MHGPCEHCPNPDKSKWPRQCEYVGSWASREQFIRSTFDPPCACDDYDEGQRERARRDNRFWLVMGLLVCVPLLFLAFH